MIASAAEVAIVGRAFLLAMGRALRAIHVEHNYLRRLVLMDALDLQAPDKSLNAARLSSLTNHCVSKRAIWLVEAAMRFEVPALLSSPSYSRRG